MKCPATSTHGGHAAARPAHVRRCPVCRARRAAVAQQARALRRLARGTDLPLLGRVLGQARDAARRELGLRLVELHRLCRALAAPARRSPNGQGCEPERGRPRRGPGRRPRPPGRRAVQDDAPRCDAARRWPLVREEAEALARRLAGLHQQVDLGAIPALAPAAGDAGAAARVVAGSLAAWLGRSSWRSLVRLADERARPAQNPAACPSLRDSLAPQ